MVIRELNGKLNGKFEWSLNEIMHSVACAISKE